MTFKVCCLCSLLAISLQSFSQTKVTDTDLLPGARVLFKDVKTAISSTDKNQIYKLLGFGLSKDKKSFVIEGDSDEPDHLFTATAFPCDLNNDGKEELFVSFGNSYTSGMTGVSIVLFIKGKDKFQSNLGFPGIAQVLKTRNMNYPDLVIGGPGFEFPIWRWDGKEYQFYRKISDKNLVALKPINIEDISKKYSGTLK